MSREEMLEYLADLERNNDRAWYRQHRDAYIEACEEFECLVAQLMGELRSIDQEMCIRDRPI